jgi:hypothetical protein
MVKFCSSLGRTISVSLDLEKWVHNFNLRNILFPGYRLHGNHWPGMQNVSINNILVKTAGENLKWRGL